MQKHVGIPCKKLITPVKTCLAYLIHSFFSILEHKDAINCLYGSMENILDRIRERKPSLVDWSVTNTVVTTMRQIVRIIIKNHSSGVKWIISEGIVDTVRVCIYCSGDEVDEFLKVDLYQMVEDQDGSTEDI